MTEQTHGPQDPEAPAPTEPIIETLPPGADPDEQVPEDDEDEQEVPDDDA